MLVCMVLVGVSVVGMVVLLPFGLEFKSHLL